MSCCCVIVTHGVLVFVVANVFRSCYYGCRARSVGAADYTADTWNGSALGICSIRGSLDAVLQSRIAD